MTAGIDVAIELRDDVTAGLGRLVAAGIDLTPAMGDIAGHLADETRERFELERDPDGVPWIKSERAKRDGGQTLTLSGDLRSSIREAWGADYAAAGPEASGGAAIYAAIHQLGGEIRPKAAKALHFAGRILAKVVIPARRYLGWTDSDSDYAVTTLSDHLAASLGSGGAAA